MSKRKPSKNGRDVIPAWYVYARSLAAIWSNAPTTLLHHKAGRWVERPVSRAQSQNNAKAVRAATELSRWLDRYDVATEAGNAKGAVLVAFQAGRLYERIQRHVLAHEATAMNSRLGGQSRSKADPSWQRQVEAMMKGNRRTWSDVCEEIGGNSGVDGKTVRNNTTNPRRK